MPYPPFDTQWKTWRVVTASDSAFISDYKPASFDSELAIASQTKPAIAFRALGKDADNETANIEISGWMMNQSGQTVGPGQLLYKSSPKLGAKTMAAAPMSDGLWDSAGNWFEVDDWTTSVTDLAKVKLLGDTTISKQATQIMPTHGYSQLMLNITLGTAAEFGVLYRWLTAEQYASNLTLVA